VAIISAFSPKLALRWLYPDPLMMLVTVVAPIVFVVSVLTAYYSSGRRKRMLLLWLLAPLPFYRLLEFLLIGLLWHLRGGMV
jgi:hypothetical protein